MSLTISAYYMSGDPASLLSLQKNGRYLKKILPTWLEFQEDGSLNSTLSQKELTKILNYKKKEYIVPLVQNSGLNSKISNRLLEKKSAQEKLINNILYFLQKNRLKAINLDMEGIKIDKKEDFTKFVSMLVEALHRENFRLGISIPAKAENNKDSSWSGAYKYKALGGLADEIILMAYDYHWPGGPAGAIAPLSWVRDVLDYAILEIPMEKIYLGIPFYGYDWNLAWGGKARGLSFKQVIHLKNKYGEEIQWDQDSSTPYVRYRENDIVHEVWFENKISIMKKIKLANEFHLPGVVFWRLGLEDDEVWPEIGRRVIG